MMLLACNPCLACNVLFVLTQKVTKKVKAGTKTARSCRTALLSFCATVASAVVILLLGAGGSVF
jgi:hypothetical protein